MHLHAALLAATLACPLTACSADNAHTVTHNGNESEPPAEQPEPQPIIQPDRDTDINEIPSDPFTLGEVTIEGDNLHVTVTYPGGAAEHVFTLYWNGITLRSFPGQVHLMLKHDANGDAAEALITRTLRFDLTGMTQPLILHIHGNGENDRATVQYGER